MRNLIALISGATFGLGLYISGMTDTLKVQGFLDLFGAWDPTLAFVMGGAIIPMLIAWRILAKREQTFLGAQKPEAANTTIDKRLILGAVFFGFGWALSGLCPGPAVASISFGGVSGLVFLCAMLGGMYGHKIFAK